MRQTKAKEMDVEDRENFGFALGEARDFIDRGVVDITDWITDMEEGRLTLQQLRQRVLDRFREAERDLDQWRGLWAWGCQKAAMPYLHDSLKTPGVLPIIRLIVPLKEGQPA